VSRNLTHRLCVRRMLVAIACVAGCGAGAITSTASATVPRGTPFVARAIGDSVTAGFGYCGLRDPKCKAGPGQPFALDERTTCTEGDYDNRCSSNKGDYTAHLPGTNGVPAISWAAQFAVREDLPDFINFAVTGSTPSQWDTDEPRGFFNFDTTLTDVLSAHPNLTLMTLGANPVLRQFYTNPLDIACVAVGTVGLVEKCARRELDKAQTKTHLEHVYERLLSVPSNHVIVMGYHTPHPALNEKLFGHAIQAYAPAVTFSHVKVIIDVINTTVAEAAADVASHGENRLRIHFVSMPAWPERDHQCLDTAHQPWVISTDFCIHPTDAGYAQFVDRLVSYLRQNPEAAGFKPGWLS
jgi:lysophospholipase L1-like esterase